MMSMKGWLVGAFLSGCTAWASVAQANVAVSALNQQQKPLSAVKRSLCVWDIMGHTGEIVALMRDYQVFASQQGVEFEIRSYVDERIASEDFRTRYCDAVLLTGLRARAFNHFTGSIEAVGAMPTAAHLRTLIHVLSQPKSQSLMQSTQDNRAYEVIGILPFGSAYGFVNDRQIQGADQLPGKTIAVFDYDKAQAKLVRELGAQPDPSDVNNFASKFNSKSVDIVIAPLAAYQALELYKGLGQKGGIIDYVLAQVSLQLIVDPERFPKAFGQQSRQYFNEELYSRQSRLLDRYASLVDEKYWIKTSTANLRRYDEMARTSRIQLTEEGVYNKRMMSLLKRIRCQIEPNRTECGQQAE
ncbi:MAG: putative solute-binding protein [Pseudomonadota bacterium]|nr:putative solute-binding protein [Pseudomonadota bacterium]